jgi:hypothetical protein
MARKDFWKGEDWAALLEATASSEVLTRTLTSFRKRGAAYRRTEEVHRLRLFEPENILAELTAAGFVARRLRGFGEVRFHSGHAGFLARKA